MKHEESRIQAQIISLFNQWPVYAFHVPNEGKRTKAQAMRLKAMGLRAGVADLCVLTPQGVVFLEVKTQDGSQSDSQKKFQKIALSYGCKYFVVRSATQAVNIIKEFI